MSIFTSYFYWIEYQNKYRRLPEKLSEHLQNIFAGLIFHGARRCIPSTGILNSVAWLYHAANPYGKNDCFANL